MVGTQVPIASAVFRRLVTLVARTPPGCRPLAARTLLGCRPLAAMV
jgi:hypothetical protein